MRLLWPRFMALSGSMIGLPFTAEGFAFFLEVVFLGLYLYGWLSWFVTEFGRQPWVAYGLLCTSQAATTAPEARRHIRRVQGHLRHPCSDDCPSAAAVSRAQAPIGGGFC